MRYPTFSLERKLWRRGYHLVCGIDEVGRGAWAGPLYAAAVIFPPRAKLSFRILDSKRLSPERRLELADFIRRKSLAWEVGSTAVEEINSEGIAPATEKAMLSALEKLGVEPDFCLIDYFKLAGLPSDKQRGVKFGDQISSTIAAASVLAKVERDKVMEDLAKGYPDYGFEKHKGYGTRNHRRAIKRFGLTPLHRRSFIPEDLVV